MNNSIVKYDLFGIGISGICLQKAISVIVNYAKNSQSAKVTALAVHGLMTAVNDVEYANILNQFQLILPDGQPIRYSLNFFHGLKLKQRVYGPDVLLGVCHELSILQIPIYIYGSTEKVNTKLVRNLIKKFPNLIVGGSQFSVFRSLTDFELIHLAESMIASKSRIVFVGLGCPLQERFCHRLSRYYPGVIVTVGAAFDFIAGNKKMAPEIMQNNGLEWLFRLFQEPGRLWRRYLFTNSQFIFLFIYYSLINKMKR